MTESASPSRAGGKAIRVEASGPDAIVDEILSAAIAKLNAEDEAEWKQRERERAHRNRILSRINGKRHRIKRKRAGHLAKAKEAELAKLQLYPGKARNPW